MARSRSDQSAQVIESLLAEAGTSLQSGDVFASQEALAEALRLSHQARDYTRMAAAAEQLGAVRQQIRRAATKARRVTIVSEELPQGADLKAGCYLVQPPRVGVDGRALREIATAARVPTLVLVREPTTRTGLWPVVALGPVTIRTKVKPPPAPKSSKGEPKPTPAWVQGALDALGQVAAESAPAGPATTRVEALVERLGAVPDSPELHHELRKACLAAAKEVAAAAGKPLSER